MRLRNQFILPNLKRKQLPEIAYCRIDEKNVRIGTTWFKFSFLANHTLFDKYSMPFFTHGVTIYGEGFKRFISNSWYSNINTDEL